MDLLFAQLTMPSIQNDIDLTKDEIIQKVGDDKSILSLNGSRVTDSILRLVPDGSVFKIALRAIKYWGKSV